MYSEGRYEDILKSLAQKRAMKSGALAASEDYEKREKQLELQRKITREKKREEIEASKKTRKRGEKESVKRRKQKSPM